MRGRILLILTVMVTVFSLSVMIAVGVLYFTQISESNASVSAAVLGNNESNHTQADTKTDQNTTKNEGSEKPKVNDNAKGDKQSTENSDGTTIDTNKSNSLKIVAVGDILLGRSVRKNLLLQPSKYLYPFAKVADNLKKGDIVFGNLEESITDSPKGLTGIKQGGKYVLKNDVGAMEGLKYAGFNLFSLANNHILDYYEKGLYDTIDILNKNNIAFTGAGKNLEEARKLVVVEKNGVKIGLLAYTDMANVTYKGNPPLRFLASDKNSGVSPTKIDYIKEDIAKARPQVDLLMVSLHWGIEYTYEPTAKQVEMAHEIMDMGADILLGHHTHRFQSIEIYKDKPIFYSLGNFIFDQNDPENQQGFMMEMEYKNKKLTYLAGTPFKIVNRSQIVPQSGTDAAAMVNREIGLCKKMNTESSLENDKIIFEIKN
jgi:poly-gamma-glutamate capsule biosynthesis protein CapA/YwtB (metallophosphatase superfamily)